MKFAVALASLTLFFAGVSTQADGISAISIVAPPFDSQVSAGVPFNITVQFQSQPTDFNIVALYFGQQLGGDPSNEELGEQLAIVPTPVFQPTGPQGQRRLNVPLTIQNPGSTNITVGTFYVVGAVKNPGTAVTKTRVQVV